MSRPAWLNAFIAPLSEARRERRFRKEFDAFHALARGTTPRFELTWEDRYPRYGDNTENTGFDRHYVYHPAWAARIVRDIAPAKHVDISSTLHFCSMLSAFIPVEFYDYRPAQLELSGLTSRPGDLMHLPFADGELRSLSCMHTVEHVGLGRYGDPLDYDGDLKAIAELKRVTAPGGHFLFVTPVGRPSIKYNAHRIYGYRQVLDLFNGFTLREYALVPDDAREGGLLVNASEGMTDRQRYGCGCFWFQKNTG